MSSVPRDAVQISRSKADSLHRTPAGFTVLALDGSGLCDILPARPTSAASYPISVRRVATLLHASFRRSLAVPPLRFASASPPSGCTGDFHPQAVGHVRHTGCSLRSHRLRRLTPLTPTSSPATRSAMPSMPPCCTSDLKRRGKKKARPDVNGHGVCGSSISSSIAVFSKSLISTSSLTFHRPAKGIRRSSTRQFESPRTPRRDASARSRPSGWK